MTVLNKCMFLHAYKNVRLLWRMWVHHQMEAQAEEQTAETQKERKSRERNEQYSRQLEEELERLKVLLQTHNLCTSVHV